MPFPPKILEFIGDEEWTYAKTMAKWPHFYLVRERVDEVLFFELVNHIRNHGYEGKFYAKEITYFDEGEMTYWTMGAPVQETIIINRCNKEDTYKYRLENGMLPD